MAKILIVDDDEGICNNLKLIFEEMGHEIDTAGTGVIVQLTAENVKIAEILSRKKERIIS